ncbi:hypothetical protein J6590_001954 [Homalodisca vitripennis]|nr:hypothetical protein J6590_001954 [Homalodisca vitripennis]
MVTGMCPPENNRKLYITFLHTAGYVRDGTSGRITVVSKVEILERDLEIFRSNKTPGEEVSFKSDSLYTLLLVGGINAILFLLSGALYLPRFISQVILFVPFVTSVISN